MLGGIFFCIFAAGNHNHLEIVNRFSKNQSIVGLIVLSLLTIGSWECVYKKSNQVSSDEMRTLNEAVVTDMANSEVRLELERQVVLNRVKDIFRYVKSDYVLYGPAAENELLDKIFCSKSWNELLMDVRRKEAATGTLFFEINYWTMTRDPGTISFDEFEVTSLNLHGEKSASVSYTVYEADAYNPARIDLVYEDGKWVIDNFHHMKYMLDMRSCMWNYIANTPEYI